MSERRRGITLVELLVVIAIVATLMALLLPAVQGAREAARRLACGNHLRQIAGGLLQHESSQGCFPAGIVTRLSETVKMDVWTEAASAGATARGWSWIVAVLPYLEQQPLRDRWQDDRSVLGNAAVARLDLPLLYCPGRRAGVRDRDRPIMFQGWASGGTDYGGCIGGNNAFLNDGAAPPCTHRLNQTSVADYGRLGTTLGILFHNSQVTAGHVRDGLSNTLLTGEMQRLSGDATTPAVSPVCHRTSQDGWAVGGVATLFTTYFGPLDPANSGGLNNHFFESAGSEHAGGAQFALADGSVHFVAEHIDSRVWQALGTCAGRDQGGLP